MTWDAIKPWLRLLVIALCVPGGVVYAAMQLRRMLRARREESEQWECEDLMVRIEKAWGIERKGCRVAA